MVWDPELGIWFRNSINGLGPRIRHLVQELNKWFGTQRVRALVGDLNGLGPGIRDPVQELKC
jgi:hypothetical protein